MQQVQDIVYPLHPKDLKTQQQNEDTSCFTQNWFIELTVRPWSLRSHTKLSTSLSACTMQHAKRNDTQENN